MAAPRDVEGRSPPARPPNVVAGDAVPVVSGASSRVALMSPAARKAARQRMLLLRRAAVDRIAELTGVEVPVLLEYHRVLRETGFADGLIQRGAGLSFTHELPQGSLLYLLVRALRPRRVVETGVGPGYSTAWLLGGLEANGVGELISLGPGSPAGRSSLLGHVTVGQFVAPTLRARWTLALGNSEERLREILSGGPAIDLFFYDNGPDAARARFELKTAWEALSAHGVLLAHRIDANPAWAEFCRWQGLPTQTLDPGPPPLGALAIARGPPRSG